MGGGRGVVSCHGRKWLSQRAATDKDSEKSEIVETERGRAVLSMQCGPAGEAGPGNKTTMR